MSNKKRISKRIQKLEIKELSRLVMYLDKASMSASSTVNFFCKMGEEITYISEMAKILKLQTIDRQVKTYMSPQLGMCFEKLNNTKFEEFLHNVKCLSGESLNFNEVCSQVPEEYYYDVEKMMMVGFKLREAVDLLKETYKF